MPYFRSIPLFLLLLLAPTASATDLLYADLGDFRSGGGSDSDTIPNQSDDASFVGFGAGINKTRDNDAMVHVHVEFGLNAGAEWLRSMARWSISYADDLNLQPEDVGKPRRLEVFASSLDVGLMARFDVPLVGLYTTLGPSISWANRMNSAGHAWGVGLFSVLGVDFGPAMIRGFVEFGARWNSIFAGDDRALERAIEFVPWDIKFGVRLFY
ncbi:hypothetical protein OAU50_06550 [Planctomycetota bacterium]|nr:hypothetical protein [Planctomycetota bacterium]